MTATRVLVVDDDPLVRAGLRFMLKNTPDIIIVGEAADGDEVLDAVRMLQPDLVFMDIRMPRIDGVTATQWIRETGAGRPQVIVLTTFDSDIEILTALRAGAAGFLLKGHPAG